MPEVAAQLEQTIGPAGISGRAMPSVGRPDLEAAQQFGATLEEQALRFSDRMAEESAKLDMDLDRAEQAVQVSNAQAALEKGYGDYENQEEQNKASPDVDLGRYKAASDKWRSEIMDQTTNAEARRIVTMFLKEQDAGMSVRAQRRANTYRAENLEKQFDVNWKTAAELSPATETPVQLEAQKQRLAELAQLGADHNIADMGLREVNDSRLLEAQYNLDVQWTLKQAQTIGENKGWNAGREYIDGSNLFDDDKNKLQMDVDQMEAKERRRFQMNHQLAIDAWVKQFDAGSATFESIRQSQLDEKTEKQEAIAVLAGSAKPDPSGSEKEYLALRRQILNDVPLSRWNGVIETNAASTATESIMRSRYVERKINDAQYASLRSLLGKNYPAYTYQALQEGFDRIDAASRTTTVHMMGGMLDFGGSLGPMTMTSTDAKKHAMMQEGLLQWVDEQANAGRKPTASEVLKFVEGMTGKKTEDLKPSPIEQTAVSPHGIPDELWSGLSPAEQDKIHELLTAGISADKIVQELSKGK